MASKRNISQKKPQFGQRRSHSLQATKRQFKLNMQWTNVYVPELGRTVRIRQRPDTEQMSERDGVEGKDNSE